MKKNKLNNKGFVLVETLIVSTFVMTIFSILYNNFYPLMGEYEKREVYDDIDGKYATYWIKQIIEDPSVKFTQAQINALDPEHGTGYFNFNCDMVTDNVKKTMCNRIVSATQVKTSTDGTPNIYISRYNLEKFKSYVDEAGTGFSGGMHKYLVYLPDYKVESLNGAQYRVIVEFHRTKDENDYLAYSTFEVMK